jgi:CBS domain-containing protein
MATIERHVTRDVIGLDASAPCREAARLMDEKRIGAVAVREGGEIIGLVTERDLAVRVVGRAASADMPVREAMRRDLPAISPRSTEAEVSRTMKENAARHLLVQEGGHVVGIISMRDVIQLMLDDKQFLIEQLQVYIDGR